MKKFENSHSAIWMKKFVLAFLLALFVLPGSAALAQKKSGRRLPKPADWSQNDWYNFVQSAVQTAAGDLSGAAGSVIPLVDFYSAIDSMSGAVKPGLILWLNRKMADAATKEDWKSQDRYNAFYTCITKDDCSELRQLEEDVKAKAAEQAEDSGGDSSAVSSNDDSTVSSSGCKGFEGKWDGGGYGIMTLAQSGNSVSGSYEWKGTQTIKGTVEGNTLRGEYAQPTYPEDRFKSGKIEFKLAADGNSWSGTWTDKNGNQAGTWSGTCIGN